MIHEYLRPDFYYYLFLEPSSQENYKMKIKIKIYFGAFPVPSQKIHKNEIKLKFYFNFFPALHLMKTLLRSGEIKFYFNFFPALHMPLKKSSRNK
jgi:hypothetical protein